ncbi:MAG TPA: hypothetical protein VER03_18325, partial [Bryobacteraceae bacterium]|nr:hypothetical protein [Bryobacteraceae bacterium]
ASQYPRRVSVQIRIKGIPIVAPLTTLIKNISPTVLLRDAGDTLRPAAAVNEDGSVNSEATPAKQGEAITLYLTGYGQTRMSSSIVGQEAEVRPLVYFSVWASETLVSSPADRQHSVWRTVVRVPRMTNASSGATPIVVLLDGVQSNTATIWLR